MTPQQTTFVLVTGAWHVPSCFDLIAKPLRDAGYKVVCKKHASVGAEPPVTSFDPDVEILRKAVKEEADQGQDVVVFMHSYGGMVGTEACNGLDKASRESAGKKGGVVKLIYCAALMALEGKRTPSPKKKTRGEEERRRRRLMVSKLTGNSLMMTLPPPEVPWNKLSDDHLRLDVIPGMHREIFYEDLTLEQEEQVKATLEQHSAQTLLSVLTKAAWMDIPSLYILCTKDRAVTIEDQKAMVNAAKKAGGVVDVVELESSHSPFLSMPEKVAGILLEAAGGSV